MKDRADVLIVDDDTGMHAWIKFVAFYIHVCFGFSLSNLTDKVLSCRVTVSIAEWLHQP